MGIKFPIAHNPLIMKHIISAIVVNMGIANEN